MKEVYGVGVLGLGVIGRWVAQELHEFDRFTVAAAYDPAPRRRPPYRMLPSAADVAADPAVDLLYIASPPRHHAEGVALAIQNRRAILCEKPLAPSVEEAERLAREVAASGLPAVVNFAFPTIPAGRALASAVDRRLLGAVRSVEVEVRLRAWPQLWHAEAGPWLSSPDEGGFTREVVTHFLALADRLLGRGRIVHAHVERGGDGLETVTRAEVDYAGVPLSLDARLDPAVESPDDMTSRFSVSCEGGAIAIEDWSRLVGAPVDDDSSGLAGPLAAVLDGRSVDLQGFDAAARVVQLIEGILSTGERDHARP